MLAKKPFIKIPKAQLMTVAGQYNGKQIICKSPDIFAVFKQLEQLARAGNHWARISIHGINELTAGRFHQNNVFVRKDNPLANGRGQFFMILPGIRATFEDTADGKYVLIGLQLDSNYQELQKVGQKPGLFNVTQDSRGLSIKPTTSIKATPFRCVAVSDTTSEKIKDVAESIYEAFLSKPETKHLVADEGFDLFYTPGTEPIVGLKSVKNMLTNYKKNNIAESSTLLADTMYSAREVKKITWQGSFGGSGILTQALQILHDQNKSKFRGHAIYLYHPTTNSRLVQNLANKLEFDSVSVSKSYTSRNEIRGNHLANMISPRNIVSMADTSLSTAATLGTLLALTGVIFSPVIGLVAAGVAVGKVGASIKKNHIAPTYKK